MNKSIRFLIIYIVFINVLLLSFYANADESDSQMDTASSSEKSLDDSPDILKLNSLNVVKLAKDNNISLKSALLNIDSAQQDVESAKGNYPWIFGADGGYTHTGTPIGNSLYQKRDTVGAGAQLSKTASAGTSVVLRGEGEWYKSGSSAVMITESAGRGSGTYAGATARLAVTQPLIRGFGNRVGLADLRAAKRSKTLAEKSSISVAGNVVKAVLDAYWELWYAAMRFEINKKSEITAEEQLNEISIRVSAGDAAMVDKLSFESNLASLKAAVLESQIEMRRQEVVLAQTVGIVQENPRIFPDINEPLPVTFSEMDLNELTQKALTESPSVHVVIAEMDLAKENEKIAGESLRQKLDIEAWLQASTLTNSDVQHIFSDFGNGNAYSGYIGLKYELPLDNRKKEAQKAKALLAVDSVNLKLNEEKNAVVADVLIAYENILAARDKLELAKETLVITTQEMDAQHERYLLGDAIYTEVRNAEERVRKAELDKVRAEVDLVKSQVSLENITGKLLKKYPLN
ncbi:MAG: TolC family protein [Deltaproteobacteria bacterium]|nr:TolC family protein [Deltaproteobacteria bacterium]